MSSNIKSAPVDYPLVPVLEGLLCFIAVLWLYLWNKQSVTANKFTEMYKSNDNESLCLKEPSQTANKVESGSFLCIAKKDTIVTDLIREN